MNQQTPDEEWEHALPPEVHLKMALDFLYARAKQLNLSVTASLIGAAGLAALEELRERFTLASLEIEERQQSEEPKEEEPATASVKERSYGNKTRH